MTTYNLRDGLIIEAFDDAVLVLDPTSADVYTLRGHDATALKLAEVGVETAAVPPHLRSAITKLVELGFVQNGPELRDETTADPEGWNRRRLLMVGGGLAAMGIVHFALPSAAAAQSGGSGGGGGGGGGGGPIPAVAPNAPDLTDATFGAGSVTLSFSQGSDGGSPITNYEYSLDDGGTWSAFSPAQTSGPVTVSGVSPGDVVRLRATNAAGNSLPSSSTSVPAVVPAAPVITAAAAAPGSVELTFTQGSDGGSSITNYEYSRDGGATWSALAPADTSSPVTAPGVVTGDVVRLRARNSAGPSARSNTVTVGTGTQSFTSATALATFTVPAGVGVVTADLIGGAGGTGGSDGGTVGGGGGQPGRVAGTLAVTAGEGISVAVGGGGTSGRSVTSTTGGGLGGSNPISGTGYDGGVGGAGKGLLLDASGSGAGGGAATVVRRGSTALAVAAGGGGGGGGEGLIDGTAATGAAGRSDVVATEGQPGTLGTGGINSGGTGAGGGGALGGARGTSVGSSAGGGGARGTNAAAGLASVVTNGAAAGRTIAAENAGASQAGAVTFTYLTATVA